jgi:hypothetical protein
MGVFACLLSHQDNEFAGAAVTSSSAATGYGAAHATGLPYSRGWRTVGLSSEWLELDLGPLPGAVDTVLLGNHNLSLSATITLTSGAASGPTGNPETIEWRARDTFLRLPARDDQYWRLTFTDTMNQHGFIQVGYVAGGRLRVFPFGLAYGNATEDFYEDLENVTEFGVVHLVSLWSGTTLILPFTTRNQAELADIRRLFHDVQGKRHPLFVIPDLDRPDGYFGRFVAPLRWQDNPYFDASLEFRTESPGRIIGG